jgi:hypothetical protein
MVMRKQQTITNSENQLFTLNAPAVQNPSQAKAFTNLSQILFYPGFIFFCVFVMAFPS